MDRSHQRKSILKAGDLISKQGLLREESTGDP
jgi:hypothetical protein